MENNDILRRARDLAERCERAGTVTRTAFLTPAEQYVLETAFSNRTDRPLFSGGGGECERRCAFFLPFYLEPEGFDPAEFIRCVEFQSFFGQPGHRDYLGAVLALGVARERIGDIRIMGDRAWVFCMPEVAPLLLELDRVGRYTVRAGECPLSEVPEEERQIESVTFTVDRKSVV